MESQKNIEFIERNRKWNQNLFATRKWNIVNDQSNANYDDGN